MWRPPWHHTMSWCSSSVAMAAVSIAVPEAGSAARRRDTSAEHSSNAGLATVAGSGMKTALPHGPNGYILSYGVSYKGTSTWNEVPQCPPSAAAVHDAFVSECGFSPTFPPTLDEDVTRRRMTDDVRRVATTMASHDVVVFFFSGHGYRMDDTTYLVDSVGSHVSVRKLQAVFAQTVEERNWRRDVSLVFILDCDQTTPFGELRPLYFVAAICSWCDNGLLAVSTVQGWLFQMIPRMNSTILWGLQPSAPGLRDMPLLRVRVVEIRTHDVKLTVR